MAGYWPSSFMDRDEVEVHKHAKKERGQYPAILTGQAWSIKDLLYGIKHHNMIMFLAGHNPYPERARWLHLARSGSQSQREIRFILPARGASRIIKQHTIQQTSFGGDFF